MNFSIPFTQTFLVQIRETTNGYLMKALNEEGQEINAKRFANILYSTYEANFYGLQSIIYNNEIFISTSELLDVFSPIYKNPFYTMTGFDDQSSEFLSKANHAASNWCKESLWMNAEINDELIFKLPNNDLLQQAAIEKMNNAGISIHELPPLLPFLQDGGWPLKNDHTIEGTKVALRLSEPEQHSEAWLLETVLIAPTGKQWTPAIRKRLLPIEMALPDKWTHLAADIESLQQQMLSLINFQQYDVFQSSSKFIYVPLEDAAVREFLRADLVKLQAFGFEIILPAWLKELKQTKLKVRVSANNSPSKKVAGLDDILLFKWQFSMNGEEISAEQFKQLVEEKREFIRIGTEWFRIDAKWLNDMRELMEQAKEENWTVRDLVFRELPETLTAKLDDDEDEDHDDPLFAFEMQRSLKNYIEQLQNKNGLPSIPTPPSLKATLRPYQQQGFEWLAFMREQQFGACLADDMGLGKTVQTISYLLYTFETLQMTEPTIIICPTSVLGNWQKELARFAPNLTVFTHYNSNRYKEEQFTETIKQLHPHIILSTYGTVSQDAEFLKEQVFSTIVLDEAQNIKNMHTQQSRAIRKLQGLHHIALTGTPVENRLSELWAIFDFIHKGYLGSFKKFQEQFIVPIERDESEHHKEVLRLKIRPFLLRRTKRDPDLRLNLPEKQESNEFCPLTVEQAALYEGFIQNTMAELELLNGFEKKGRILKMLSKLKQLCNHPALYLKEPFEDATSMLKRSNKLKRIVQLASEIVENGEQCLIFTQYIGMGNLLQHCFAELYNLDVPFLTGSMTKQQRDRLVEAFQAGEFPIFILSLKAGGTGLNLTAANHVLHADRWWNPAVENQATDRAYRIGQTQFVQVHKFVTIGTIEEKIDKMIEIKSALSEELIQSSQWLTELKDDELLNLMMLDTASIK